MELEVAGRKIKADVRKASDLKPVLAFPEKLEENFDAYYMFRDIFMSESDHEVILKADLRYDYTIIPPAEIGGERIKTYGHYHPEAVSGLSYPEVYQVLEGRAIYLLQKLEGGSIVDCIAVEASKGDVVIIPPNYGHVTINPADEKLMMANWVCRSFSSIYDPYTEMRGACYYYIGNEWVKNDRYGSVPELKFAKPVNVLNVEGEMYKLVERIEDLRFLVEPHKHLEIFESCLKQK